MTKAAPEPKENMGEPLPRVDAVAKVTGRARYAADFAVPNVAHAVLLTSTIAKGGIQEFELSAARAVPGIVEIFTHENIGPIAPVPFFQKGGPASTEFRPMAGPDVVHDGQIIGLVVADTFEAARMAAHLVTVNYETAQPTATAEDPGSETKAVSEVSNKHEDPAVGDAEAALRNAEVAIDVTYRTPTQHHNPMELFSTTASWSGDELTIYEPSQFVYGLRAGLAKQLQLPLESVHVVSPYVGGAFGSKGSLTQRTAIVAVAARQLGRPVKLVVMRDQGFTVATYRAETRHHVRLGARRDGHLNAYAHEGFEVTSRTDDYYVGGTENTAHMYGWENVSTKVNVVRADRNTPGFMRSPPEVPYMFALEAAMDEMAEKLGLDPVEFRRRNDISESPIKKVAYTSRSLMACYDAAAAAFGWSSRNPRPASMRDGDWLIGYGCATATYPTQMSPAAARVRLTKDARVKVQVAAHDVGTGAYTVIGQQAAVTLGLPLSSIEVELGDTRLPPGPVAGGSITTASVCSVVKQACERIVRRLQEGQQASAGADAGGGSGGGDNGSSSSSDSRSGADKPGTPGYANSNAESGPLAGAFERLGVGAIEEYAEWAPQGSNPGAVGKLYEGSLSITGGAKGDKLMFAFGAEFVEVRIHALTHEIRVPRIVGAFAGGRIVNARTANSQYLGGLVWGIGSALHKVTEIDRRAARYVNDNIAEYLIPVNADIRDVEIIMIPEVDNEVNPAGVKGIGELANVGTAAAIVNAVYHATGKRVRDLPVRIESLLS